MTRDQLGDLFSRIDRTLDECDASTLTPITFTAVERDGHGEHQLAANGDGRWVVAIDHAGGTEHLAVTHVVMNPHAQHPAADSRFTAPATGTYEATAGVALPRRRRHRLLAWIPWSRP